MTDRTFSLRPAPGFLLRTAALCLALSAACPPAMAATDGADADLVSLNFVNADIESVVRAVGKISGKNFIIDPRVKGTLNIVSAKPVSRALTYQILLSALRLQGYTVVESDGIAKVVPEADAKLHASAVGKGRAGGGDRLVTEVFAIKNESAAQLVPVLRPLIAPNNTVTAYPNNNTLVITDYAENMDRLRRIIESIDVPQGDVQVVPVKYASAVDLAATVTRLLAEGAATAGQDASQKATVVADPRSNGLLVRSENPSKIAAVRQLVAALDQPGVAGNVHVIYLKNAEATKVAQTLRAVLSGDTSATTGASTSGATGGAFGTSSLSGGSTMATPMAGTPPGAVAGSFSTSGTGQGGQPTGSGIVQADPASNALIITASEPVYNNLRRVVEQLDRRRAQVYVEALIAEVTSDRAAEFGIQWQAANGIGSNSSAKIIGGTNFGSTASGQNILGVAANLGSVGSGFNFMVAKGSINIPGLGAVTNLSLLARFLETEAKANILSTPNLVMLDNEEAKIVIGQNLPFVTGQYAQTGTTATVTPFQTIERRDVGLTLKVKPQISEGGTIRLQVFQEASSVVAASTTSTTGPITNKRSLESTVLADDGSIIAIGGLVEDSYQGGQEKVPLLGDIPLVGPLFRYDTRKRTKTNLIIFLRPKILRDRESYAGITSDRYDYVIGEQKSLDAPDALLRREPPAPRLPSAKPAAVVPAQQ